MQTISWKCECLASFIKKDEAANSYIHHHIHNGNEDNKATKVSEVCKDLYEIACTYKSFLTDSSSNVSTLLIARSINQIESGPCYNVTAVGEFEGPVIEDEALMEDIKTKASTSQSAA